QRARPSPEPRARARARGHVLNVPLTSDLFPMPEEHSTRDRVRALVREVLEKAAPADEAEAASAAQSGATGAAPRRQTPTRARGHVLNVPLTSDLFPMPEEHSARDRVRALVREVLEKAAPAEEAEAASAAQTRATGDAQTSETQTRARVVNVAAATSATPEKEYTRDESSQTV